MKRLIRNQRAIVVLALVISAIAIVGGGGVALAYLGGTIKTVGSSDVRLQRGLAGWWKMDGSAKDATPHAANGTVTGATLTADQKGAAGSAYSFSGSSQYITVPYQAALHPTAGLSIGLWVKPTNIANTAEQKLVSTTESGGYALVLNGSVVDSGCSTYSLCLITYVGGAYRVVQVASSSVLTNGTWAYIAVSYDGSIFRLYVNGSQVATTSFSGSIGYVNNNPICIGSEAGAAACTIGQWFDGQMNDVRIYGRALNTTEVTSLYQQYNPGVKMAGGEKGLVGWWKMEGNAKDSSPYGRNGTVSVASLAADRKARANSAYSFNGSTTYIDVADFDVSSTITVSAWVKPTGALQSGAKIVGKHSGSSDAQGTLGFISGMPSFEVTTGGVYHSVASGVALSTVNWSYVTGVYDGTNVVLYVNGVSVATTAASGALATNAFSWVIGGLPGHSATSIFTGAIDDVRIYNRALALADVVSQYNSYNAQINLNSYSNAINLSSGLVSYWKFNGNANDATPYQNNGTLVNSPTLTTDRLSLANSAYGFNGSTNYINAGNPAPFRNLTKFTTSFWINPSNLTSNLVYYPFSKGSGATGATNGWAIGINGTFSTCASHQLFIFSNNTALCGTTSLSTSTWVHVAITYNSGTANFYLNGALDKTGSIALNADGTQAINIARRGDAVWYYPGAVDDVRLYNRVLSGAEVTALYGEYH